MNGNIFVFAILCVFLCNSCVSRKQLGLNKILVPSTCWSVKTKSYNKYYYAELQKPIKGASYHNHFVSHLDSNEVFHKDTFFVYYDSVLIDASFFLEIERISKSSYNLHKAQKEVVMEDVVEYANQYYRLQVYFDGVNGKSINFKTSKKQTSIIIEKIRELFVESFYDEIENKLLHMLQKSNW